MFEQELNIAKHLARQAGQIALMHYGDTIAVEYKSPGEGDPVTQADKDANKLIVDGLLQAFPDDGILAEESPLSTERLVKKRVWCIDPIDGTREFIARNGEFAVMIGLAVDGVARLGVVYQPTRDVLYWGATGQAFREQQDGVRALAASALVDPSKAVLMVSRSHRSDTVARVAVDLRVQREEPLGSVGLKLARLAEGVADIYLSVSTSTHEWDICAPEAILRAAGGIVTDARGIPLRYNKEASNTPFGILATNGPLHAACVAAARPVLSERGWSAAP